MGTSAIVTKDNLFSQSFTNLFNFLNDRDNIPDPIGNTNRTFVYTSNPHKGRDFKGHPFIFIEPADIDIPIEGKSIDNKNANNTTDFTIEIRSSNRMTGSHSGKGKEYLDSISNSLYSAINSVSNQLVLRTYFMNNPSLVTEDTGKITIDGESIYFRRFRLTFETRMAVSD